MNEQNTYPIISEKSWWILRERFQASLPSVVSTNYVKTLLSMGSDASANNNVIVPMKRLGLIDDENKPTDLANEWRIDSSYKGACDKILQKVYPKELLDLFAGVEVDRAAAKSWFMGRGVGENTASSMVAVFTLINSGEIKGKKDRLSNTAPRKTSQQKPKKDTDLKNSRKSDVDEQGRSGSPNVCGGTTVGHPTIHIDLQIHISPESSPEQIEMIFASIAKHIYIGGKS